MDRSPMRRRPLLARLGFLSAILPLSGRLKGTRVGARGDDELEDDPDFELGDTSIERLDSECATRKADRTSVRLESDRVTVGGILETPTPCYLPVIEHVGSGTQEERLEDDTDQHTPKDEKADDTHDSEPRPFELDPETRILEIVIGAEAEEGVCIQCVGEITYEATLEFAKGAPEAVRIVHETMDERREIATLMCDM